MEILIIVGSLRKKSINHALAHALQDLAPKDMQTTLVVPGDLPLYNQDVEEAGLPVSVVSLKTKIRRADGIIVVTPEYNRGMSGVLKNMFDWTGRPYGDNAWPGKPVGVVGASNGNIGTALAQYDVKHLLNYYDTHVMGQPEFYLNGTDKFDAELNLKDEKTKEHVSRYLASFATHVAKIVSFK